MSDQTTAPRPNLSPDLNQLITQLRSGSEKTQLQIIPQLASSGETGEAALQEWLLERQGQPPTATMGKIYQTLFQGSPSAQEWLKQHFPTGVVPLNSERTIDYTPILESLVKSDYLNADRLTLAKLCELAGETAIKRKWLYFTEVESFPITDLQTLDQLWFAYSEGQFGLTVQREIWLSLGKNWDKLWPKIGWRADNTWTRYPNGFTWDLSAPKGHLPLSNQLRGVRVMAALLSHPAWG